jgi:hypothetical protein
MVFEKSLLFEKLNDLDDGRKYVELINSIYDKFKDYLEAIKKLFGDYTDHGIKHSESVLRILDGVYELKKKDENLFNSVLSLFESITEEGIKYRELTDEILWCADKNILFVNPIKRIVKPQSKLDLLAIKKVIETMNY